MKSTIAESMGYVSTGVCDINDTEYFNKKRAQLKEKGYKTVIVNERTSSHSRSGANSPYRVLYVEQRYEYDKRIEKLQAVIDSENVRKENERIAYEAALANIANSVAEAKAEMSKLMAECVK